MMLKLRPAATAALVAFIGSSAIAQTLADITGPAEVPPLSYTASQYVDSRGCIFVRAGVGDGVTWVPRVTRDKRVLCGYQPTFAETLQPAPAARPAPEIVIAAPTTPSAPATAAEPAARPARPAEAVAAAAAPPPSARPAAPVPAADPGARASGAPAAAPSAARIAAVLSWTCPRLGSEAGRYHVLIDGQTYPCPAPAAPPAVGRTAPQVAEVASAPPAARPAVIPEGYKSAWDDDRLNTQRGPRTATGDLQMAQVMDTAVVPMRSRAAADPGAPAVDRVMTMGTVAGRYVQVGTFGVAANADAAAVRLRAAGLPVAMADARQGGKAMTVVMAGPFADGPVLRDALAAARGAGFRDAFVRN